MSHGALSLGSAIVTLFGRFFFSLFYSRPWRVGENEVMTDESGLEFKALIRGMG